MFNRQSIRASTIDLAAKTKEKKRLRREALARWRTDRSDVASMTEFQVQHSKALERGSCARYWGLCYAFVRGKPYRTVEQYTHAGHQPSAHAIMLLLVNEAMLEPVPAFARYKIEHSVRQDVEAWLKADQGPTPTAAPSRVAVPA
jgi:hypothetical protein